MQIGARHWAEKDRVRQKLARCFDGMQREERIRVMRDQWRAEVGGRVASTAGAGFGFGYGSRNKDGNIGEGGGVGMGMGMKRERGLLERNDNNWGGEVGV
ncbi:hypothetical protein N658DRAFT_508301 [Parathielavia hyrcaniae]|uniref:Uncharacterized protein n=1 Tax=Parathielavia hyrcaniae TaxID=113614 RepID=A0AAN6T0M0_9PEZI|nr:hypothetical protein N658DRAFT_508301 [Parathielavia hyrcaniae]